MFKSITNYTVNQNSYTISGSGIVNILSMSDLNSATTSKIVIDDGLLSISDPEPGFYMFSSKVVLSSDHGSSVLKVVVGVFN